MSYYKKINWASHLILFALCLSMSALCLSLHRKYEYQYKAFSEIYKSLREGNMDLEAIERLPYLVQTIHGFETSPPVRGQDFFKLYHGLEYAVRNSFLQSLETKIDRLKVLKEVVNYLFFVPMILYLIVLVYLSKREILKLEDTRKRYLTIISKLKGGTHDLREERDEIAIKYTSLCMEKEDLLKRQDLLEIRVEEANECQKEMKQFVDVQIETNEQLMIAESKLKNLLEKEQESKAIINQTLDRLKETQGQLVHSEKMASLGQLTAGIAHEINNPINFVYNGIGSLRFFMDDLLDVLDVYEDLEDGEDFEKTMKEVRALKREVDYEVLLKDVQELIQDIEQGAVRTIEIVKGLRVFSRLDEEDSKKANINECLEATLILLKNKMKNRIELVKELDPDLPSIVCFPGQLNQVFMNILNNAIQAIPEEREGAEITVRTEMSDGNVVIRLKDNGKGMKEEVKKRIFEPFFTTKPVGVGTGLGMSISFGIIEKHYGSIEVESQVGVGTEFIISIPEHIEELYAEVV